MAEVMRGASILLCWVAPFVLLKFQQCVFSSDAQIYRKWKFHKCSQTEMKIVFEPSVLRCLVCVFLLPYNYLRDFFILCVTGVRHLIN